MHSQGNLALGFLGESQNKFDRLNTSSLTGFMLKDHQKPHVATPYKVTLISLFSSIP